MYVNRLKRILTVSLCFAVGVNAQQKDSLTVILEKSSVPSEQRAALSTRLSHLVRTEIQQDWKTQFHFLSKYDLQGMDVNSYVNMRKRWSRPEFGTSKIVDFRPIAIVESENFEQGNTRTWKIEGCAAVRKGKKKVWYRAGTIAYFEGSQWSFSQIRFEVRIDDVTPKCKSSNEKP